MKALTLYQPWASLIAWREKQYETRGWSTLYRGPLAIHASKNFKEGREVCAINSFYREALARAGVQHFDNLPIGAVLCLVDLVDVVKTETLNGKISQSEEHFGDYSWGRYAWKLENVRVLKYPFTQRGSQGLWEWDVMVEELEIRKDGA